MTGSRGRIAALVSLALVLCAALAPAASRAEEQVSAEDMNKSNNPLNPAPTFNLQDYYTPSIYGSDRSTNDILPRGAWVLPSGKPIKPPQIIRLTVPISTRPNANGGSTTGLGDINLLDILILGKSGALTYGAGPLLTMPTASDDVLGTGKWQIGVAGTAVNVSQMGVVAGLLQWQASFAGDGNRSDVNTLTFQPLLIHNLKDGLYLRSTAVWSFDLKNSHYYIPLGIGAGKVLESGTKTLNAFLEPQWTIAHDVDGYPKFTLFFGLNTTFGK